MMCAKYARLSWSLVDEMVTSCDSLVFLRSELSTGQEGTLSKPPHAGQIEFGLGSELSWVVSTKAKMKENISQLKPRASYPLGQRRSNRVWFRLRVRFGCVHGSQKLKENISLIRHKTKTELEKKRLSELFLKIKSAPCFPSEQSTLLQMCNLKMGRRQKTVYRHGSAPQSSTHEYTLTLIDQLSLVPLFDTILWQYTVSRLLRSTRTVFGHGGIPNSGGVRAPPVEHFLGRSLLKEVGRNFDFEKFHPTTNAATSCLRHVTDVKTQIFSFFPQHIERSPCPFGQMTRLSRSLDPLERVVTRQLDCIVWSGGK